MLFDLLTSLFLPKTANDNSALEANESAVEKRVKLFGGEHSKSTYSCCRFPLPSPQNPKMESQFTPDAAAAKGAKRPRRKWNPRCAPLRSSALFFSLCAPSPPALPSAGRSHQPPLTSPLLCFFVSSSEDESLHRYEVETNEGGDVEP